MILACLDLEGVLVPEIWINVAERSGIAELRRTKAPFVNAMPKAGTER